MVTVHDSGLVRESDFAANVQFDGERAVTDGGASQEQHTRRPGESACAGVGIDAAKTAGYSSCNIEEVYAPDC